MKNTYLPALRADTSPPMRKVSRTNLDVLFNALILILNLDEEKPQTQDLIVILTSLHNSLVAKLDIDADATIALYKNLSRWFLEFVRGNRLPQAGFKDSDWSLNHSCPTLLTDLVPFTSLHILPVYKNNPQRGLMLRVIYALLSSHRVVVTPMKISYSTITDSGVTSLPNYGEQFKVALNALGISPTEFQTVLRANCANAKLRIINTAGPNGQATWTAYEDACALKRSPSLFSSFKYISEAFDMEWIMGQMVHTAKGPATLTKRFSGDAEVAGRIHAIEEWGGKTRLVAILDYWTQALLTPLHDTIAFFLKRLANDGTFDQNKIITLVQKWTSDPTLNVYSYDLTAATDRLPVTLQEQLLTILTGDKKLANAWRSLLTDRDFITPEKTYVRYAVGQPMGSKSSFPMLGLLHHVLVQVAAQQAKVTHYNKYVILGDDLTLTNGDVGDQYLSIMGKIGVPINLSKSVIHHRDAVSAGEICKRIFIDGFELTSLPVKLIVKTQKHGYLASDLQNIMATRGWAIGKDVFLQFLAGLIDKKSLQGIIILNSLPTTVSGLTEAIDVSAYVNIGKAFHETLEFGTSDLEAAFTYALVTEQLKRVDSVLKSTEIMAQTIAEITVLPDDQIYPSFLFSNMKDSDRAIARARLPKLNWSHPIVTASYYEYERVMSHLTGLRAGSASMVKTARSGLLDILRNSLSEIWATDEEKSGAVSRSIFNAAMAAIRKLASTKAADGEKPTISFSLLLGYVQRMWTVSWTLNSPVYINAVKSKVNINTEDAKAKLSKVLEKVDISSVRL
nr:RNA-dependent RNA polymerase [Rhizophagus clarus mitovirus 7]